MEWPFLNTAHPFGLAHQGGDEVAPGNTMAAFENAVSLGFTYIETDVQATADGVLVVFHDDDLQTLAKVAARIDELPWSEVKELRVHDEHPIPRFDDVVAAFDGVRFNIDPKAASAVEPLIDAIRAHDLVDRVLVGSFSDRRVGAVRRAIGDRLATSPGPFGLVDVLIRALIMPWWRPSYAAVQIPTKYWSVPLATSFLDSPIPPIGSRGARVDHQRRSRDERTARPWRRRDHLRSANRAATRLASTRLLARR